MSHELLVMSPPPCERLVSCDAKHMRPAARGHHSVNIFDHTELLRVARRVIRFEEPEQALADPIQFLAHVMVFGTVEHLKVLLGIFSKGGYREVLKRAPPGIFDARSWAYWNLVCGRNPAPPLPVRILPHC